MEGRSLQWMENTILTAALTAGLTLVAGCDSKTAATPKNYTTTLNAWLVERPDCLFPESPRFPLETSDPVKTKQMDSLIGAQLLTKQTEPAIHVSRYTPTTTGARVAPRFCYGHREVTAITDAPTPAQANGFPETKVTYQYKMMDVPVWAKSAAVLAAFPKMADEVKNGGTATTTLAKTMAGWQVPD